jgi:phosphatidylserine/phosphatidylglycerophosphate/cardiolipin synthase-like enzyme
MIQLPELDLTAARMRVYMSPFHDTLGAYLDVLRSAEKSIHINIFGFHVPAMTDILIAKHKAGVVVDVILDHSQAEGRAELAEIRKLQLAGVPFLIGTSSRHGQLLHLKATVVDGQRVECGSWNYSESASDQLNDVQVIDDVRMAEWYLLVHDIVRAFIVRHERIFQPRGEPAMAAALAADGDDAALDPAPDAGQVHRQDVARPWLENARVSAPAAGSKRGHARA